ncbi:MAG: hypothetical protein ACFCAD_05390 [Pleurocapsa sp.]
MKNLNRNTIKTRVICPPPPSDSYLFTSIYSITLRADQDVEWQWLELPDGNRVVIDYKIIERQATEGN